MMAELDEQTKDLQNRLCAPNRSVTLEGRPPATQLSHEVERLTAAFTHPHLPDREAPLSQTCSSVEHAQSSYAGRTLIFREFQGLT